MEGERKIFSLSDMARSLRSVIERTYTSSYWIKAEIAKLNFYPRSGHCYPDLVEKSGDQIMAQMRSTIWAAEFKSINQKFIEVTGEPLREGAQILFSATVSFHPVHGFSLHIQQIEPSFTLGQMAL
ncbi:MAG TPA: exodeoxyribonuclease VII large subunit, partial [Bacteroidales bacterium]|nr:exodeoxyribonuclease VII large subunit [Bacteroidales bacterium]